MPLRSPLALLPPLALSLLAACGGSDDTGPMNALLVTLDTTRADALSCYGHRRDVTPKLDILADWGVLYEQAFTSAPLTLPAHASILTGLYPIRHGVRDNGLWPLVPEAETLAERAKAGGFQTAAFVSAVVLDARFGLDQGFDVYDAPPQPEDQTTSHYAERDAAAVVDAALDWLKRRKPDQPFFLWVHFFDPHAPYAPPEAYREGDLADEPYLGEIAYVDAQVGRLIEGMVEGDLFDETYIAVVGDHGEAFGEHDEVSHGPFCYDTTLRVPLLLHDPGILRNGRRSTELVSVVDLYPTLSKAMGLGVPPGLDGESLYRRTLPPGRGIYFESLTGFLSLGWSPLFGWRDEEGKYLHSSKPQFFDVARDPGEASDLLAGGEPDVGPYRAALAEVAALPRLSPAEALDEELMEELRALGYAATGAPSVALPEPLDPSDRPSPAERAKQHLEVLSALQRFNAGDVEGAFPTFARIASENPANLFVLDLYAYGLMRLGRHAEAIEPLQRIVAAGTPRPTSLFNLGVCLRKGGRVDEARAAFERTLELDPTHADALAELSRLRRSDG